MLNEYVIKKLIKIRKNNQVIHNINYKRIRDISNICLLKF
jgi:hypothetical protein